MAQVPPSSLSLPTHQALSLLLLGIVNRKRERSGRLRGRWAPIQDRGSEGDAPKVLGPRWGRRCGSEVRNSGVCAVGRWLHRVEGVAIGPAQIKREARRASALRRPR